MQMDACKNSFVPLSHFALFSLLRKEGIQALLQLLLLNYFNISFRKTQ